MFSSYVMSELIPSFAVTRRSTGSFELSFGVSSRGMSVIYALCAPSSATRSLANHIDTAMQNAEAGPSFVLDPALSADTNEHDANTTAAPLRPLPSTHFYSIEYPGYVKATSVPLALERIGGQASVDSAFKRIGNKGGSMLELNLRPGNPFSHPIPGEVVPTNNLVLKVVKRKKVRRGGSKESTGEYTVSAVGMIPKTARFRSE